MKNTEFHSMEGGPVAQNSSMIVLDPTHERVGREQSQHNSRPVANAPRSMSGIRVGLLANGKPNSQELLDALLEELKARPEVSVGEVVRVCKASVSVPPDPRDMQRLVENTDLVLVAVGD
jgi:hypothetical protein